MSSLLFFLGIAAAVIAGSSTLTAIIGWLLFGPKNFYLCGRIGALSGFASVAGAAGFGLTFLYAGRFFHGF